MVCPLTELFSFGRAGVECYCQHESGAAVIQLQFLVNEVSPAHRVGYRAHLCNLCSPSIQLDCPAPRQHSPGLYLNSVSSIPCSYR
jgi:hypothetical protein